MNAYAKGLAKALLLALLFAAGGALASRIAGPIVTGTVSSVSGTSAVTIDGKAYAIRARSAASSEVAHIQPGDVVDAMLDGPTSSPDAEVIDIALHVGA